VLLGELSRGQSAAFRSGLVQRSHDNGFTLVSIAQANDSADWVSKCVPPSAAAPGDRAVPKAGENRAEHIKLAQRIHAGLSKRPLPRAVGSALTLCSLCLLCTTWCSGLHACWLVSTDVGSLKTALSQSDSGDTSAGTLWGDIDWLTGKLAEAEAEIAASPEAGAFLDRLSKQLEETANKAGKPKPSWF
jgi:hypothetical protein